MAAAVASVHARGSGLRVTRASTMRSLPDGGNLLPPGVAGLPEGQRSPRRPGVTPRISSAAVPHPQHPPRISADRGPFLQKNRFNRKNQPVREPATHRRLTSRDRRKLEELSSRETWHPAIFAWQTQFAGTALRILRSSLGRAGIGGSSRSFWIFRPVMKSTTTTRDGEKATATRLLPSRRTRFRCRPGGLGRRRTSDRSTTARPASP